ncbi:MAG: hypothetical protein GY938_04040 [Ketobacter sp.]|nr:hypothetical protein [Ketobacter sp.]
MTIRRYDDANDTQFREVLHEIKGASADVGVVRLAGLCDQLLSLTRLSPHSRHVAKQLEQMDVVFERTVDAILDYLDECANGIRIDRNSIKGPDDTATE